MAWTAKGGVTDTANSAILMPCDAASFVVHPSVRTFAPDAAAGVVRVANYSAGNDSTVWPCLALRDAGETDVVTISADCKSPLARFTLAQVWRICAETCDYGMLHVQEWSSKDEDVCSFVLCPIEQSV